MTLKHNKDTTCVTHWYNNLFTHCQIPSIFLFKSELVTVGLLLFFIFEN